MSLMRMVPEGDGLPVTEDSLPCNSRVKDWIFLEFIRFNPPCHAFEPQ